MIGITRLQIDFLKDSNSEPMVVYATGVYIDSGKRIQYYHPITGEYEIKEVR